MTSLPIPRTPEDSEDARGYGWSVGGDSLSGARVNGMTGSHARTEDTVSGIKKRFCDMRLQANLKNEEFKQDFKNLSTLFDEKDRERFTKDVRILKKKVVLEYERLKGDDGFWVLAVEDHKTVEVTIRDMKVLIGEQIRDGLFKVNEWDPKWERQYDVLLETLRGSLEVKDREGFIAAIKQAKLRIEEDTTKIMSRTYSDWESASEIGINLYK
uniref:Uncharacterized protein n=1 Tax=Arcella intermedia TaxID=1963864 RepID=A0A6B2L9F4_9EUKA